MSKMWDKFSKRMSELIEIKKELKNLSSEDVKKSTKKFVPSAEKIYGVKSKILDNLSIKYKEFGFELVENLWDSGGFEERLLASKILGKICNKNQKKSLELIKRFSNDLNDWAVCDALATQGIKKIAFENKKEIFNISEELIKSDNHWKKRFAIVLLINFSKDKSSERKIKEILSYAKNNQDHYVKKAVEWMNRELNILRVKNAKT